MLQDLDYLAARIGQLVQHTRQLQAERDALRLRLNQSEATHRALEQRCDERQAEIAVLNNKLQEHESAVDDILAEARQSELDLKAQIARAISEQQAFSAVAATREAELRQSLSTKEGDLQRLRVVADAARERIDTVLARLPGGPVNTQLTGESANGTY